MKNLVLGAALAAVFALPSSAQVAVEVGPEVREYILQEGRSSVRIESDVEVGAVLPGDVEIYEIEGVPTATEYRYAVVNDRRVLVEPETRRIVRIVD